MDELFDIYKLTAEDALKIAGKPNEPHVHEFEELIVGVEGQLEHFIDFSSNLYEAPYVSFIAKSKMHKVKPIPVDGKCSIWVIRFNTEFIPETSFMLYSLYHDYANVKLNRDDSFKRIVTLCEMIHGEMQQVNPSLTIVRDLLKAIFSMIEAERDKITDESQANSNTQNTTFKNFLLILEENFRRSDVGVEFYAEKLFMSARNLNLICQNVMNKSVSEIIEARRLTEGMNLLTYTDKTVSEIGFELGYNEKSCFTSVFKKKNGQTPTAFRKQMRQLAG